MNKFDMWISLSTLKRSTNACDRDEGVPARTAHRTRRTPNEHNSAFPPTSSGALPPPATRTRGTTSTATRGSSRTSTPTIFKDRSGKATDGWNRWESDLDLVAGMGLNAYRFSVEWARVEPAEGEFSEEALAHYEAVVDGCLARGLAPIVTFNHFTSPHWFAARGAWLDAGRARALRPLLRRRDGPLRRSDRTRRHVQRARSAGDADLGGAARLHPELERATLEAAGRAAGVERYRAGNVMLREDFAGMRAGMTDGHRAAKAAIKARRPDLPVGLSLAIVDDVAAPGGEELRDRKRAEVYEHWLEAGPRRRLRRGAELRAHRLRSRRCGAAGRGRRGQRHGNRGRARLAARRRRVRVRGQRRAGARERARHRHRGRHACAPASSSRRSRDSQQAIAAGVPVLGYCHWTLMDNFEWIFGYGPKLGLHSVDRETFERTAKPSAEVYAGLVAEARGL